MYSRFVEVEESRGFVTNRHYAAKTKPHAHTAKLKLQSPPTDQQSHLKSLFSPL